MRLLTLTSACILFSLIGHTQPVVIDDLETLIRFADEHSPRAQQASLQPLIAQQEKNAQSSVLYPSINAFGTADYYPLIATQLVPAEFFGGDPGTFLKVQFGLPYVYTAGAEVSLPVIHPENWAKVSRAKSQYEQREWNSQVALENVHLELIQTYYQALALKEVLALNEENEATTQELLRIMTERYQQQVVEPSDYNRTKNLALDVQTSRIDGRQRYQSGINKLMALLAADTLVLQETLTDFNWPLLYEPGAISNRPGWREAAASLQTAELSLQESRRSNWPELSLVGRYSYNRQTDTDEETEAVDFSVANVGLRLNIPLFQGRYYHSLTQSSRLQLEQARLEQQQTQANLSQQQKDWLAQYQAARDKHAVLEEKVETTEENLRIARLNLQEEVMEFDQFNDIFLDYNRARIEYLQNLADGIVYHLLSTQNF
uniref:TolC family protein n=1 Tax=Roseihalotalea indica TaxID=2867963 RepID=A0AA49GNZ8_9BACT|nr:TolC family protein [Tunicatimonas sp. TK19036]